MALTPKPPKGRVFEEQAIEREMRRDDPVGSAERRSAVKGMMAVIDALDEAAASTYDDFRYLEALMLDAGLDEIDEAIAERADEAVTLETLWRILWDSGPGNTWYQRLQNLHMPALKRMWERKMAQYDPERYVVSRPTMADDVNAAGLEGYQLEAKCGKCQEVFIPSGDAFVGLNNHGEGLYEHYLTHFRITGEPGLEEAESWGERECGGYGVITGGYRGLDRRSAGEAALDEVIEDSRVEHRQSPGEEHFTDPWDRG